MDPLSITASVAGIVSIALEVTVKLFDFYSAYKDRDQEVTRVVGKLKDLQRLLKATQDHIGKREFGQDRESKRHQIEELVRNCAESIEELQDEYSKFEKPTFKMGYPFRKSTLERMKECVDDAVSHISGYLQLFQLEDVVVICRDVEEICDRLRLMRADQVSSSIRDWLKAPDATAHFNDTIKKRHPGTGRWFIEGHAFSTWLSKAQSFLWLFGFAGCGKSVLSSTVIEHLLQAQNYSKDKGLRTGIGFFYFSFREEMKQDSSAMLRALILQLSQQLEDDHKLLSQFYDKQRHAAPSDQVLMKFLKKLLAEFNATYIVLDGLDEVPSDRDHREEVLQTISAMRQCSIPGLHILVTSREEVDIQSSLFPGDHILPEEAIPLSNCHVNDDITSYICGSLDRDPELEWIKRNHHDRVREKLASRAAGV